MRPPAVFLDRDDTLTDTTRATADTEHPGDLVEPDLVALLPRVDHACRRLVDRGLVLIGISNQGCVARGAASIDDVHAVNQRIFDLLARDDPDHAVPEEPHPCVSIPTSASLLAGIAFCPFHPRGSVPDFTLEHPWRKPAPGMILDAVDRFRVDAPSSWLIGDARRDVDAGIAAGLDPRRCLLIGERFPDLAAATDHLLRSLDA